MSEELRIELVRANHKDLVNLIQKLDQELLEIYPPEDIFGMDLEKALEDEHIRFAMAYVGQEPVGCGAVRPLDEQTMELKRFYVDASRRQMGIASRILAFLEDQAHSRGYTILRLETGELLRQAVSLYKKFGFYEIDRYGPYVDCKQSLCMEKKL